MGEGPRPSRGCAIVDEPLVAFGPRTRPGRELVRPDGVTRVTPRDQTAVRYAGNVRYFVAS